jgi:hypothetical protein
MYCDIFRKIVFLSLLFVGVSFSFGDQDQDKKPVPAEDQLKVYQMIADQSGSNYERIKTWQGEYTFEERFVPNEGMAQSIADSIGAKLPSEYIFINKGTFTFYIDIRKDALFVDYRQTSVSIEDISGTPIRLSDDSREKMESQYLKHILSIVTPKEFISFDKTVMLGSYPHLGDRSDRIGRVAFRYPSVKSTKKTQSIIVDPRSFMICGGTFIWDHCHKIANKSRPLHIKTDTNESNLYLNELTGSPSTRYQIYNDFIGRNNTVFEYIVDSNVAFNITMYASGTGFVDKGYVEQEKRTCEYEEIDGVYVPSLFHYNLGGTKHKSLFKFSRRSKLLRAEINKPLPTDVFTIKQMELEDGDRFCDEIKNKMFEVVGGKIVPVNNKSFVMPSKMSIIRIVIITLACVLIFIGTFKKFYPRSRGSK